MIYKLKRLLAFLFLALVLAAFPFSVIADDDFEDIEQYNEIDFEFDTDSEVQEVTPEVTPAEADPEVQDEENDGKLSEITPEVTPAEADPEVQDEENDGNLSEITPEVTSEPTPEPDSTISELIETVNHNFDSLHSDNIHLMVVVCIGIGSIIGFLLISKILP